MEELEERKGEDRRKKTITQEKRGKEKSNEKEVAVDGCIK